MQNKWMNAGILGGVCATLLAGTAHAQTSKWVGEQPGTYTGSNFSFFGGVLTAQQTATAGVLSVNGTTSDLLGINGIWLVSPTDGTLSGVAATTGGPTGGPDWTPESDPAGFGGHPGYGSGPKSDWITLGPTSEVLSDHGNASPFNSGVFNFTGYTPGTPYDVGVDYLLANGNTGRAYFSLPGTPAPAVPESPASVLLVLGSLALAGPALRARKRCQS